MRTNRYVMFPGYVTYDHDHPDCHYIAVGALLHLYNIKDFDWDSDLIIQPSLLHKYKPQVGDIHIRPDSTEKYKLPKPLIQKDIK